MLLDGIRENAVAAAVTGFWSVRHLIVILNGYFLPLLRVVMV